MVLKGSLQSAGCVKYNFLISVGIKILITPLINMTETSVFSFFTHISARKNTLGKRGWKSLDILDICRFIFTLKIHQFLKQNHLPNVREFFSIWWTSKNHVLYIVDVFQLKKCVVVWYVFIMYKNAKSDKMSSFNTNCTRSKLTLPTLTSNPRQISYVLDIKIIYYKRELKFNPGLRPWRKYSRGAPRRWPLKYEQNYDSTTALWK